MASGGISKSLEIRDMKGNPCRRTIVAKWSEEREEFCAKVPCYLTGGPSGWSKPHGEDWAAINEEGLVWGKTPKDVFKAIEAASRAYTDALTKRLKIIGYTVSYEVSNGALHDMDAPDEVWKARSDSTSLSLKWGVAYLVRVGDKESFQEREDGGYLYEPEHWVEWTQEREDFFRNTELALAGLGMKFNEFFVTRKAEIAAKPNLPLLPGPGAAGKTK